ncbi:MAG: Holliday junction resolvase RuvX [Candidatus Zixiibacteriota bacterium]
MNTSLDRTFIAIDFGERRIGLAKSDPMGVIASALETIEVGSMKTALARLKEIIERYRPDGLVIGYPLLLSGDRSDKCDEVDRFIEKLTGFYRGPIHRVDEHYSSKEAAKIIHAHGRKTGQDKKRLDRLAAVIILQRFLDESP